MVYTICLSLVPVICYYAVCYIWMLPIVPLFIICEPFKMEYELVMPIFEYNNYNKTLLVKE